MGAGKSAQQLKALTAVAWNPGLVPSTHIGGSQSLAGPRGSDPFQPPWSPAHKFCTETQTGVYAHP